MSILICGGSSDLQALLTTAEVSVVLEVSVETPIAEAEDETDDDEEEEDGSSHADGFSRSKPENNISSASISLWVPPRPLVPTLFLVEMMAASGLAFAASFPGGASLATDEEEEEPPAFLSTPPPLDAFDALTPSVTSAAADRTDATLPPSLPSLPPLPPGPLPSSPPPPPRESSFSSPPRRRDEFEAALFCVTGNMSGGRQSVPTVFGPNMSVKALKPHAAASSATLLPRRSGPCA